MTWKRKSGALLVTVLGSLSPCWAANSPDACHVLSKHGQQAEAKSCYESLVRSDSAYFRAEGYWGLEQYDQANEQFRIATAAPDSDPLYKVRWGRLLHERFNNTDAVGLFQEALQKDPKNAQAYLGLAIVSADGFDGKATDYVSRALVLDPKLVEAHEFAANLALEDADTEHALAEADEALRLSPDALNAMAIHASVELLADRSPEVWLEKIRKVNPGYAEGYTHVAHYLELNYRFEDAIVYDRKAID